MEFIKIIFSILCSILASSGLWTYFLKKSEKNDAKTNMLIGLAHDRILYLGMNYIERGFITKDEYENLYDYLYKPYKEMGGNGSAKHVMEEVDNLQIKNSTYRYEEDNDDKQ